MASNFAGRAARDVGRDSACFEVRATVFFPAVDFLGVWPVAFFASRATVLVAAGFPLVGFFLVVLRAVVFFAVVFFTGFFCDLAAVCFDVVFLGVDLAVVFFLVEVFRPEAPAPVDLRAVVLRVEVPLVLRAVVLRVVLPPALERPLLFLAAVFLAADLVVLLEESLLAALMGAGR